MTRVACIYFEGNDSKVALFEQQDNKLKLLRAESMDMSLAFAEQKTPAGGGNGNGKNGGSQLAYYSDDTSGFNKNYLQKLNEFFKGEDLSRCQFIPVLTEPAVYFQKINNTSDLASLNVSAKGRIDTTIDFIDLFDNSRMAVYPSGQSNYLQVIDSLAQMNHRKFLKINSVKNAEISLASFVARKYGFSAGQITLVLYVGKDYSKLIFLNGDKLANIGSKVAVGKNSFNAHNVIISKILLEIEHDSITNLDNIIICGEDDTDELTSALREAFPVSKVKKISLDIEVKEADKFTPLPGFAVPIAAAEEYYIETSRKLKGINLLPNYVKEEQKIFNIGWQGYILLFLIMFSVYYFAAAYISNIYRSGQIDDQIKYYEKIQAQNKAAAGKLKSYETRLANVDQTKATLQRLSDGTGVLSSQLKKLSDFANVRRTLWFSGLLMNQSRDFRITGFTFSRPAVKTLSDSYPGALLESIIYEPLRDMRTFKFTVDTDKQAGKPKPPRGAK